MNIYRHGAAFEYRVKHHYEDLGYHVTRSAGSHGLFDLVAVNANEVLFIQCKTSKFLGANGRTNLALAKILQVPINCRKILVDRAGPR